MRISDVMTSEVESIGPDDTLQEAAQRMKDFGVGPLPVCENHCVVGMVTDRDITLCRRERARPRDDLRSRRDERGDRLLLRRSRGGSCRPFDAVEADSTRLGFGPR